MTLGPVSFDSANTLLENFKAAQASEKKIYAATTQDEEGHALDIFHVDCRAVYGFNMKRYTAPSPLDIKKLLGDLK